MGRSRDRRLGLLPSLLLGALLSGGATLFYLSRKGAQHQRASLQQKQGQHAASLAQGPTSSSAIKEATIAMVSQAQEILDEVRDATSDQPPSLTVERSDPQRPTPLITPETQAQPLDSSGEATAAQALPAAAPNDVDKGTDFTAMAMPTISERQPEAMHVSSLGTPLFSAEEIATTHRQQPISVTPPTPSAVESTGQPPTAPPQTALATAAAATDDTAGVHARIKEHMPVLDSKGRRVGAVDRVEASGSIKLAKDGQGKHHWLPLRWVSRVDTQVHLGRTTQQVRREWKTSAPRAH